MKCWNGMAGTESTNLQTFTKLFFYGKRADDEGLQNFCGREAEHRGRAAEAELV